MGRQLTKSEALKLITPVIDNEVSEEERAAFMAYIAQDDEVKREYKSMKALKTAIRSKCPSAKAPESLRKFVSTFCASNPSILSDPPIYDVPSKHALNEQTEQGQQPDNSGYSTAWYYAAAAIILVAVSLWGYTNFGSILYDNPTYNIEEYAYQHFTNHQGQLVSPTISTASLGSAEIQLAENHGISMIIPELEKAEFKGVVFDEFVPSYKAPMLEYYLPGEDQYIYIFAFKIDEMEKFGKLVRDPDAVKACTKARDFYIREVNGKHVVSWKWNQVWYAAISNHDGSTLASLVKPLEYDPLNNAKK